MKKEVALILKFSLSLLAIGMLMQSCKDDNELYIGDIASAVTVAYGETASIFRIPDTDLESGDNLLVVPGFMPLLTGECDNNNIRYENGLVFGRHIGKSTLMLYNDIDKEPLASVDVTVVPTYKTSVLVGHKCYLRDIIDKEYNDLYGFSSSDESVCAVGGLNGEKYIEGMGAGVCYVESPEICIEVTVTREISELPFTLLPKGISVGMSVEEVKAAMTEYKIVEEENGIVKYAPFGRSRSATFHFFDNGTMRNVEIETGYDSDYTLLCLKNCCIVDNLLFYMGGVVTDPRTDIKYCPAKPCDWGYLQIYVNNINNLL